MRNLVLIMRNFVVGKPSGLTLYPLLDLLAQMISFRLVRFVWHFDCLFRFSAVCFD